MSLTYNKKLIPHAKELRKNATPWENKLWYEFLRTYPLRFQRQKAIDAFIVDFYCHRAGLIVELDGSGHYTPEQMAYDENRTKIFSSLGLRVLRFANTDVDENFEGVCLVIEQAVQRNRKG